MFFKKNQIRSWNAPFIQWSSLSDEKKLEALDSLLDSNPLLNLTVTRACGFNQTVLRRIIATEVDSFVKNDVSKFSSDERFQIALENRITRSLVEKHYRYCMGLPVDQTFTIKECQFWWLASYFVCRKNNNNFYYFHFFSEEFFHEEFYNRGFGKRHPAIVMKRISGNMFLMVPFTHKPGEGKLEMINSPLSPKMKYAIYKFYFYACCEMFKVGKTKDFQGLSIKSVDFVAIEKAIKNVP